GPFGWPRLVGRRALRPFVRRHRDDFLFQRLGAARIRGRGQRQRENAAFAYLGFERERAIQELSESSRNRKSESGAVLELRAAELHEFLEDALTVIVGYAGPLI